MFLRFFFPTITHVFHLLKCSFDHLHLFERCSQPTFPSTIISLQNPKLQLKSLAILNHLSQMSCIHPSSSLSVALIPTVTLVQFVSTSSAKPSSSELAFDTICHAPTLVVLFQLHDGGCGTITYFPFNNTCKCGLRLLSIFSLFFNFTKYFYSL